MTGFLLLEGYDGSSSDKDEQGHGQEQEQEQESAEIKSKEDYFIQNGGILLEKCIALSQGQDTGAGQVKILSAKDIEYAVNCYKLNIIISCRAREIIYRGTLEDSAVAISCPQELKPNCELIDYWLNEVATIKVMNHDNMVKLYGCCLETCIPVLVYEFLPNQSLYEHLHGAVALSHGALKWDDRLRVATEVAYVLSYMHTALSKPLVHRDVQSYSIFFDDSFCRKLARFGHSVSITPGETSQRWPVQGTPGYIDPEHVETQEVTDKRDVYSFGVLMLELLTRKYPLTMARKGTDLVDVFISVVEKNNITEILDNIVLNQASGNEIEQVVQLVSDMCGKEGCGETNYGRSC